jgi:catechol 2,3-dioxygenase-like lactoylglutathione lyase family enzyme
MQKILIASLSLLLGSSLLLTPNTAAAEPDKEATFSSVTVDIGMVAADLEKSAEFYTEALGLKETKGFTAPAEMATAFGLTDNHEAVIRVFILGEGEGATRLKLMSFPNAPGAKPDQKFIHSTIGVSYLTLRVTDMAAALARLKKAKIELLGETPSPLGGNNFLTCVRDPDGNFIELIGPMKSE